MIYPDDPHPYLIQVAYVSTIVFVALSCLLAALPVLINFALVIVVLCAFVVYSALIGLNPLHLLHHFYKVLAEPAYIDHSVRHALLLFWLFNLAASVLFVLIVAHHGRSTSIHRKFFHLTLSLVFVSGILIDAPLLWLSSALLFTIFSILEMFRFHNVPPWGEALNSNLNVFKDHQDGSVLLTPLFLLAGVNLPLLFSSPTHPPPLAMFAGVAAVGVGDSVAAIVGSKLGKHHWPRRQKTIEGSIAMFVSVFVSLLLLMPYSADPDFSLTGIFVTSLVLSAVEAFLVNVDNVVLPIVGYGLLHWLA